MSRRNRPKQKQPDRVPSAAVPRPFKRWCGFVALLIVLVGVVSAAHWPVLRSEALIFDDSQYLTDNPLVSRPSWQSVGRFWSEVFEPSTVKGYYQPMTMTSLMLDYAGPGELKPFRRTSLILHVLNTVLIAILLFVLFGRMIPACGAALLFGLHPLTVEPIAWLAERGTLLAAMFGLLSILAYIGYVRRRSGWWYAASLSAFALAMLSKPTAVALPAMLLVMDWWPLRRLNWRALWEKLPFYVLAGVFVTITVISRTAHETVSTPGQHGYLSGLWVFCYDLIFYISKIFRPTGLASFYPYPDSLGFSSPMVSAGAVGTTLTAVLVLVLLRWTRAPAGGVLFFVVALSPTVQVVRFSHSIAADKYVYLPMVGLLMLLAWGMVRFEESRGLPMLRRGLLWGAIVVAAILLGWQTRRQIDRWQDSVGYYEYMIEQAPDQPKLYNNLAKVYADRGRYGQAVGLYEQAVEIDPGYALARYNLGMALMKTGDYAAAAIQLEKALPVYEQDAELHYRLGYAYSRLERPGEAISQYEKALVLNPELSEVHNNLAALLSGRNRPEEALEHLRQAVSADPDNLQAHGNYGMALIEQGRLAEAAEQFEAVLRIDPYHIPALLSLARLREQLDQRQQAIDLYKRVLKINKGHDFAARRLHALEFSKTQTSP